MRPIAPGLARLRIAACVVALLAPAHVRAQVVRVTLRDSLSNAPIAAALVAAVDERGTTLVERLSGRDGDATLGLPGAATVRIRVRRIGIVPTLSAPVAVRTGETVTLALRPPRIEQPLPPVTVAAAYCAPGSATPRAAALWERLRIALQSSALRWSDSVRAALVFERTTRVRDLTTDLREASHPAYTRRLGAGRPYTATDAAALRRGGWVQNEEGGSAWYAPDDAVLASDWFRDTHCFTVPAVEDTPGVAEVRFTPVTGTRTASIEGSAFVDTITGDPQRITFRYIVPGIVATSGGGGSVVAPDAGGEVGLAKRDDGSWYVARWLIRVPRIRRQGLARRSLVLTGYREDAGEAIPIDELGQVPDSVGASPLDSIRRRTIRLALTAVAGDSFAIAPLGPVTVRVRDGDSTRQVVTDCYGRTMLDLPIGRTFRVTALHAAFPTVDAVVVTGRTDSAVVMRLHPDPAFPPAFRRWRGIVEPRTLGRVAAQADSARDRRLQAEACALLMRDTVQLSPTR
jgi:hypothetical protein